MRIKKEINPSFRNYILNWKHKFYFVFGGYGSSKSYNTAFKIIRKLLKEKRKCLVIREVYSTHRDSTFSLFKEIISDMGLEDIILNKVSPLEINFPNGSQIIFRGMDKPEKLKSINDVTVIWCEECSELKYEGFKELIGRLRHPTLKLHFILTTNPVSKTNWSYKYFFIDKNNKVFKQDDNEVYLNKTVINENTDTYYHHSTVDDNRFVQKEYIKQLDEIKEYDEDLYRIAREGKFGAKGKKVIPNFKVVPHNYVMENVNRIPYYRRYVGMDFGFVVSYNAVIRCAVDEFNQDLYIYYCYYDRDKTDDITKEDLKEFTTTKELIFADCAEPKTIQYYRQQGFNMFPCTKAMKNSEGSRLQNTKKMRRFKHIYCSDLCTPVIDELQDLVYKEDKNGEIIENEFNIDPHTFSALWYALDQFEFKDLKKYKTIDYAR